jgi:hypothetical protein
LAHVSNHLYPEFLRLYAPAARGNYRTVADKFDRVATQFTDCAHAINVEAGADSVVESDRKAQQCWRDALGLSRELESLVFPLMCAAALCGAEGDPGDPSFDLAALAVPLTIANLDQLHKRHAWNRWHLRDDNWPPMSPLTREALERAVTPTPPPRPRCGRWSGLISLGAEIRAADKPGELMLATPPRPYYVQWVPARVGGGHSMERRDPESEDQPRGLIDRIKTAAGIGGIPE